MKDGELLKMLGFVEICEGCYDFKCKDHGNIFVDFENLSIILWSGLDDSKGFTFECESEYSLGETLGRILTLVGVCK